MEDGHVHKIDMPNDCSLFAVFDGHGGKWLIFCAFGFTCRQGSCVVCGKQLCKTFGSEGEL